MTGNETIKQRIWYGWWAITEGGAAAVDELVYGDHWSLHFYVLVVINTKTVVAKWQKPATAAAAAAGKRQPNILYMQCVRDGVQQTAMQYRKMGVREGHITFSVQSSRTASEHLGRTRSAHYISYVLFSIFQQIVSTINLICELVYILI